MSAHYDNIQGEHVHICPMHLRMTVWHCFRDGCLLPMMGRGAATCPSCLGRLQEMAYAENAAIRTARGEPA